MVETSYSPFADFPNRSDGTDACVAGGGDGLTSTSFVTDRSTPSGSTK